MTSQNLATSGGTINRNSISGPSHKDAVSVEGLEDIFEWASDVVADGADREAKVARDERVSKRVLELVREAREQKSKSLLHEELAHLHRRVIALLQSLANLAEENNKLKQTIIAQKFALLQIVELKAEVKRLKEADLERVVVLSAQKDLMNALAKLKKDRDFLEELVIANERENTRLARLYGECTSELAVLKTRKWWHALVSWLA